MATMTKQEVYEQIRSHFTKPGAVLAYEPMSKDSGNGCVYRLNQDPKSPVRCAFGLLIPDEVYHPEMENKNASDLIYAYRSLNELYGGEMPNEGEYHPDMEDEEWVPQGLVDFINEAQLKHDNAAMHEGTVESFVLSLDELAMKSGLEVVS